MHKSNRNRVMKASDIFAKSTPFFGAKSFFEDAFPEIETVSVKVDFGYDYHLGRLVFEYNAKSLPGECIDCRNPRCFGGGFSIGEILRQMIRTGETVYNNQISCRGYEGSPKGRRRYGSCDQSFKVHIKLECKIAPK